MAEGSSRETSAHLIDSLWKWVNLPTRVFIGLSIASAALLLFDGDVLDRAFQAARIWTAIAFWLTTALAVVGAVSDVRSLVRAYQRKQSIALAKLAKEAALSGKFEKYQADAFERLNYLNPDEYKIIRYAVVANSQSFTGNAARPALHTLLHKKIISTATGVHDEDRIPCTIPDWMWRHLQKNRAKWIETRAVVRFDNENSLQVNVQPLMRE